MDIPQRELHSYVSLLRNERILFSRFLIQRCRSEFFRGN